MSRADPTRPRDGHNETLWDRVDSNRAKTSLFVVGFVVCAGLFAALFPFALSLLTLLIIMSLTGTFVGGLSPSEPRTANSLWALSTHAYSFLVGAETALLLLGIVFAVVHLIRVLRDPVALTMRRIGARLAAPSYLTDTRSALHDMAIAAGLSATPELYLLPDALGVNALLAATSERGAAVGVTHGFVDRLSREDQAAVFANLIARLCSGDVVWLTMASVATGPLWTWRRLLTGGRGARPVDAIERDRREYLASLLSMLSWFMVQAYAPIAVPIIESFKSARERAARAASIKADAEGMLLIKDPARMLGALEGVLREDNGVPDAGAPYAALFYCWPGADLSTADDPDMRRLGLLREVLGAAGA